MPTVYSGRVHSSGLLTTYDLWCACSAHAFTPPAVLIVVAPGTPTAVVPTSRAPPPGTSPLSVPLHWRTVFLCLTDRVHHGFGLDRCLRGVRTAMARVKRTRADSEGDTCFAISVCSSLGGKLCVSTTSLIWEPGGVGAQVSFLCVAPPSFPSMEGFSHECGHGHRQVLLWFEQLSPRSVFSFVRLVLFLS